jgi:uncharacterized membrane protein YtjA (UPF0391 family)
MKAVRAAGAPIHFFNFSRSFIMLKWAIIFAVIALIAGFLGFGGVAAGAAGIAKVLFVLFLVVAAVMLVLALMGGKAVGRAVK